MLIKEMSLFMYSKKKEKKLSSSKESFNIKKTILMPRMNRVGLFWKKGIL